MSVEAWNLASIFALFALLRRNPAKVALIHRSALICSVASDLFHRVCTFAPARMGNPSQHVWLSCCPVIPSKEFSKECRHWCCDHIQNQINQWIVRAFVRAPLGSPPRLDILLPCLWDRCRCAECIALEATGARDDTRFMQVHYDELKSLAESLFARTADDVTDRMDVWARSMDPKWGKREVLHDLLDAQEGNDIKICDILAMERRAERDAATLVAGGAGDGDTAIDPGDAAGSGADDDDADPAARLAAQTAKAGTITDREAEQLRNGTPLGRVGGEAYFKFLQICRGERGGGADFGGFENLEDSDRIW